MKTNEAQKEIEEDEVNAGGELSVYEVSETEGLQDSLVENGKNEVSSPE